MIDRIVIAILALCLCGCDAAGPSSYAAATGSRVVVRVDAELAIATALPELAEQMRSTLRDATPPIMTDGRGVIANVARVHLLNAPDTTRAMSVLGESFAAANQAGHYLVSATEDGYIELQLTDVGQAAIAQHAANLTREQILEEFDPSGDIIRATVLLDQQIAFENLSETGVAALHAMAEQDFPRISFHIVRDDVDPALVLEGILPSGTILAPPMQETHASAEVVERRPAMRQISIESARAVASPAGGWAVAFEFRERSAQAFCRVTTENQGKRFALLVNDQVLTAPVIVAPICEGSVQIDGNFTQNTASDFAQHLQYPQLSFPIAIVNETGPPER